MKKVFVTGGTGFLGRHLVEALLKENNSVKILVRETSNIEGLRNKSVEIVYGDIENISTLRDDLKDIESLYHCAADTRSTSRDKLFRTNVEGTKNVCQAALEAKVQKLIFVSSSSVLGGNKELPLKDNIPYAATTEYARSKVEAEKVVISYRDKGIKSTIIRPAMIYGDYGQTELLNTILRLIKKRLLPIISDNNARWQLAYIQNVADAMVSAGKSNVSSGCYLIADKEVLTVKEIITLLANSLGVNSPVQISKKTALNITKCCRFIYKIGLIKNPFLPRILEFFIQNNLYDITPAVKELGYAPSVTTADGLQIMAKDWLKWTYKNKQ